MYNHLRGKVAVREPLRIVVDAGGVGYEAHVPLTVSRRVPPVGGEVTLLVHLIVREDELRLVGFLAEEERQLFRRLVRLGGVGPGMALQLMSALTPQDFALAVERQDMAALRRAKGIGEKLAKRIIVELKGAKARLPALLADAGNGEGGENGGDGPPPGARPVDVATDAANALETMGLTAREADLRVARVLAEQPGISLEDCIVAALHGK